MRLRISNEKEANWYPDNVLWLQAFAAFAVWIAAAFAMKRFDFFKSRIAGSTRRTRVLFGSVGFLLSGVILLGALYGTATMGGVSNGALNLGGFIVVTLAGILFVGLQAAAASSMISLVMEEHETAQQRPTSDE